MSLLTDGKLAATIATALGGIVYPITIRRTTAGTYVPGVGVTPGTTTDHAARGFLGAFSAYEIANGLVQPSDVKVTLLAAGMDIKPTPATDTVQADGRTLTIVTAKSDPAGATWSLQCR
ncbi:hypothetical protein FBZ89_104386 [Nitrospirillum amazonense]|uniref:Uncharacterized protein n=1 Tax=Nitrospirillum amazonense TaxID=28077 RepID=A0A560FKJ9_9PROT|nr:hypothetical protein [Nitrospirillum amazonense]TWB22136.1 hypothetical protein FBZ89_104386 [Nitrospirillum amazonense]